MTTETMTIHCALANLKVLDERINKEILSAVFCTGAKRTEVKLNGMTVEDFKKSATASYDKINSLIARRDAIKGAVALSNAKTIVNVCGKDYTVAEVIFMNQKRAYNADAKKRLLEQMSRQYGDAVRNIEMQNARVDQNADSQVATLYGNKTGAAGQNSVNPETVATARNLYIEANRWDLFDGLGNIKDKIDQMADELERFAAEADAALSVSNATTMIKISY